MATLLGDRSVNRRRLAGLVLIALAAGALWVWGAAREAGRTEAMRQRVHVIIEAVRWPSERALPSISGIERIEPALREFVNRHVEADEAVVVEVHRGPAPATQRVDASHHAVITEPDGAWLKINVHCEADGRALEVLGYVRSP